MTRITIEVKRSLIGLKQVHREMGKYVLSDLLKDTDRKVFSSTEYPPSTTKKSLPENFGVILDFRGAKD